MVEYVNPLPFNQYYFCRTFWIELGSGVDWVKKNPYMVETLEVAVISNDQRTTFLLSFTNFDAAFELLLSTKTRTNIRKACVFLTRICPLARGHSENLFVRPSRKMPYYDVFRGKALTLYTGGWNYMALDSDCYGGGSREAIPLYIKYYTREPLLKY